MDKILKYLNKQKTATVKEIAESLNLSRQYIHQKLKKHLENKRVIKLGSSPFVYYQLNEIKAIDNQTLEIDAIQKQFLENYFIQINALGQKLEGLKAMEYWCEKQQLPLVKTIDEYMATRKKYLAYYNHQNLIDGTEKLRSTNGIEQTNVEKLFYLDFYAIERFGKTRLGTLMHFAKQGQNKRLMQQIVQEIKERITRYIQQEKIDAVLFVPPTIKREVQIMKYLETHLSISLPHINIRKVHNEIVIPQKALSKIHERVENAKVSFVNIEKQQYKKVLIIDDAVGSGATINEIAKKLIEQNTAKSIIGLAITGSYKGFDVITEI